MQQDNDFIYRKDLSQERIHEIQEAASALRYTQNCITAAIVGAVIAILTAMLFGVPLGLALILIAGFGAAGGYAFYACGKYLEQKHKADNPQTPDENESSPQDKQQ